MTRNVPGAEPARDGLPDAERAPALLAVSLGVVLAVLDGAVANVALPVFSRDLHVSPAAAVWVVNAYQLAVVALLLPAAALGERVGYRRVYLSALFLFTITSVGCALAPSLHALVACRALQGASAAGLMSLNGALLRLILPRSRLGRGAALIALTVSLSAAAGPTVAAAVLAVAPWPFLFAINLPIGLGALALGVRTLPTSERGERPFDGPSALLNALAFGSAFVGFEFAARGHGTGARDGGLAALAIAAIAAVLLFRRERHERRPMLPVDLLAIPLFAGSIATSIASFCTQGLAFVALPFLFSDTLRHGPVATGLLMTPWPLAIAVVSPVVGRLADRHSAATLGGLGLALLCVGCVALAGIGLNTPLPLVVGAMAVAGLGFGLFQSPNNRTLLLAAPLERAGAANGMLATARLTGQTAGASVAAVLLGFGPHGPRACLLTAATVAAVAAGLSLLRLRFASADATAVASSR